MTAKPMSGPVRTAAREHDDELDDSESTALVTTPNDAMVDVQVATAKRFPRSVAKFRKKAFELACLDEETAGECMFTLPRGQGIEGPSVRLAEILLYSWTNARAEAVVIEESATHVKAQGTFYDLERNVAVRKIVARRITDKRGNRYNDDMIVMTGNAACSIALRNAVFAGIPKAIWKPIYTQARQVSIGEAGAFTTNRDKIIGVFGKMKISIEKLCAWLGVNGIEDIQADELIKLRGLANAIKDGEASLEETFSPRNTGGAAATPDLNARINQAAAQQPKSEPDDLAMDREIAEQDAKKEKGR